MGQVNCVHVCIVVVCTCLWKGGVKDLKVGGACLETYSYFYTCIVIPLSLSLSLCLSRRHRMSEADEDDELLDDGLGNKVMTMFSENPWCK